MKGPGLSGQYLFVGGPWDGQRRATDGTPYLKVPIVEDAGLADLLEASIDVLSGRPTAVPEATVRVARYQMSTRALSGGPPNILLFDRWAYAFTGWES